MNQLIFNIKKFSIVITCLVGSFNLAAQTAGPGNPSSSGTGNLILGGRGTVQWSNTSNLYTSDNIYASLTTTEKGKETYEITAGGFGFSIPSNAVINGILVEVERYYTSSGAGTVTDQDITLLDQNGVQSGTIKNPGLAWPASDAGTYQSYGGPTDLWGSTIAYSQINDPDFGIAYSAKTSNTNGNTWNLYIDHVRITIYYSISSCDRYSVATGNWSATSTWSATSGGAPGASVPTSSCNVYIENGNTVGINANAACNSLTVTGSVINYPGNNTLTVNGNLVMAGTSSITGNNASRVLNVLGSATISPSAVVTINGQTVSVSGVTYINGTFDIASTTGTKSFTDLIVNNGGTLNNNTVNEDLSISGNLQNSGTFNAGSGTYTLSGGSNIISGTLSVPSLTLSGTYTNNGKLTATTFTVSSNFINNDTMVITTFNCNSTATNYGNISVLNSLTGSGTFTQGTNSALDISGGTFNVSTFNGSNSGNTVNYSGTAQTVKSASYHHVTISGSSTKTLAGDITVNGDLNLSAGTLDCSTYQITGNASGLLTLGANTVLNIGALFPTGFTSANTTISSSNTVNYNANSAQVVSTIPTYGNLSMTTGTSNVTKSLSGSPLNVTGNISLVDNGVKTVSLSVASATINLGGNFTIGAGTVSFSTGILNLNGSGAQTVPLPALNTVQVDKSSGTASLTGATTTLTGDLTVTAGSLDIGGITLSVTGNTNVTGTLTFSGAAGNKTFNNITINGTGSWNATAAATFFINGNLQNDGTFTANSGNYTFNGAGKTMSGLGNLTFATITINTGASYTTTTNTTVSTNIAGAGSLTVGTSNSLTIGGTCTVTTFVPSNNNATVTFNSTAGAQSVPANTYYNLAIDKATQTATLSGDISVSMDLTITSGSLSIGANNVSVSGVTDVSGTLLITSATGTKSFGDINLSSTGTFTNSGNSNVTVNGSFLTDGAFTPGSGTYTFAGTAKTFTGSAGFSGMNGNITGTYTFDCAANSAFGALTVGNQLTVAKDRGLNINTSYTNNGTTLVDAGPNGHSGSLITPAAITNTGTCSFKTSIAKNVWHCISSPFTNAQIEAVFSDLASHNNNFYRYDETSAAGYWVQQTVGTMNPGQGYYTYYFGNKYKTYSGTYNSGNVNVNLTYSAGGRQGWNFVGNPYPSAIDWDAAGWTKTNIEDAVYIKNGAGWDTYVGGVGNCRYIYQGQGFFVKSLSGGGSLGFSTSVQLHRNADNLKGTRETNAGTDPVLQLSVSNDTLANNTYLRFKEDATPNFDKNWDAYKIFSELEEYAEIFTLTTSDDTLAINSTPFSGNDTIVPLGFKAGIPGTYKIKAEQIINFDPLADIFLEDVQTGVWTNLKEEGTYNFASGTGNWFNRFFLHFKKSGNNVEKFTDLQNLNVTNPYYCNNKICFIVHNFLKSDITIELIDIEGRVMYHETPNMSNTSKFYSIEAHSIVSGYYLLRVSNPVEVISKKVLIIR